MPRQNRFYAPEGVPQIYLIHSLFSSYVTIDMDQEAKERLRELLYTYAEFIGVKIYSYVISGKGFHLLLEIKDQNPFELSDEEILQRYSRVAPQKTVEQYREFLSKFPRPKSGIKKPPSSADTTLRIKTLTAASVHNLRYALASRIGSLSHYLRVVKQRHTQWFNPRYGQRHSPWEARFESILLGGATAQERQHALLTVAAYFDLLPVRETWVEDPSEYAFCSYGAASGAATREYQQLARQGLAQSLVNEPTAETLTWAQLKARYRPYLYAKDDSKTWQPNPLLTEHLPHMHESKAMGSKAFLENLRQQSNHHFVHSLRQVRPRPLLATLSEQQERKQARLAGLEQQRTITERIQEQEQRFNQGNEELNLYGLAR